MRRLEYQLTLAEECLESSNSVEYLGNNDFDYWNATDGYFVMCSKVDNSSLLSFLDDYLPKTQYWELVIEFCFP